MWEFQSNETYEAVEEYLDEQWFEINTKLQDLRLCDCVDSATDYYMYGPRTNPLSEEEVEERQLNLDKRNQCFIYADKYVHFTIYVRHREKRLFDVEVSFRFPYQAHRGQRLAYRGRASNVWIKGDIPIELWLYREFNCILRENNYKWPEWDNRDDCMSPAALNKESNARRAFEEYFVSYKLEG